MSDTPIAEEVAAALGMSWPLHLSPHEHMAGVLVEDSGVGGSPEGCGLARTGPHPLADWYNQRGFDGQANA